MSGTYGASLYGSNADHLATTGVMLLSVPTQGLTVGKVLIFDQGLMYAGTATGTVDIAGRSSSGKGVGATRGGKGTLIAQLGHYVVRSQSDGIQKNEAAFMDSRYNGVLKLSIQTDYFTGTTSISGTGNLFLESIRLWRTINATETWGKPDFYEGTTVLPSVGTATGGVSVNGGSGAATTTSASSVSSGENSTYMGDALYNGNQWEVPTFDSAKSLDGKAGDLVITVDGLMQSPTASTIDFFGVPTPEVNWGIDPKAQSSGATGGN